MGSSTVQAQKLANEANIAMTRETNETNTTIAESANRWNRENLQMQNQWNLEQWNRENEYNSPVQQVSRYLQAGINPLWAMKGGDAGNAQQLTSGQAAPAEVPSLIAPQMMPEYDPSRLTNIVAASQGVVNSVQGFQKLALEALDTESNIDLRKSQQALNAAEATFKQSQKVGQELQNKWSIDTLDVRVSTALNDLQRGYKELDALDANTEQAKAKTAEINASRDLIGEQLNQVVASIRQRDRELDLMARQVTTGELNANVNAYNARTNRMSYQLEDEKFGAEVKKWNNEQIFNYLSRFTTQRSNDADLNAKVLGFGFSLKGHDVWNEFADLRKMRQAGIEIISRAAADPSTENLEAVKKVSPILQSIEDVSFKMLDAIDHRVYYSRYNSSNTSVLNPPQPSVNWQQ